MNQSAVIRGLIGAQLRAWEGGALGHLGLTVTAKDPAQSPTGAPVGGPGPLPRPPARRTPRAGKPAPSPGALEVLAYLRQVTGRDFRDVGEIDKRLGDPGTPRTVEECKLVIDWLHLERRKRDPQWVEDRLDHTTPFYAQNFDKYLAQAKTWRQRQQAPARPGGRVYMHA